MYYGEVSTRGRETMKLVVQIPCLNEEVTLASVLATIPKKIPGIDEIITLIIDDGSTDQTIEVAKKHGVEHFVLHAQNMGLAQSFQDGVTYALEIGADIVVNTDGDNQYPQEKITELVEPILKNQADIVIADRQTSEIEHFSWLKKTLQRLGSRTVNWAAGTNLPDAASGFRAYSKKSLLRLNVTTKFSYAMETIIQAGNKGLSIVSVPIKTNPKTRDSRLFKSTAEHVRKSAMAIMRAYLMYRPYAIFASIGSLLFILGGSLFLRYLFFYFSSTPSQHIQSLLLGTVFLIGSFLCFVLGIVSDLIRVNRILLEESLEHLKATRFKQ